MKFKSQILVEVIVAISVFVVISIGVLLLFVIASRSLKYSLYSLVSYNLASNYSFILLGLTREKFSILDSLEEGIDYYLSPTSSGYEIKEGKELYPYYGENYYVWFRIINKNLEGDPSLKLINIFVQTPGYLEKSPILLSNLKEKVIFQDEWKEATSSIIMLENFRVTATSLIYYATKSPNIQINGEIYFP